MYEVNSIYRMLSILVGLTGVGKSSVLSRAKRMDECPSSNTVNYGDVLLEIAQDRDLASERDELTEIPPEPYSELQEEVPRRISEKSQDGLLILDTHAALFTPSGYRPGLPKDTIEVLEPDNITFIKAAPKEILSRRKEDDRDREILTSETLREQQQIAINMATTDAVIAGCPLKTIENPDGLLEVAAKEYSKVLSELVSG